MARGYSLGALTRDLYNLIYPVGICIDFDNNTNPNNTFAGTTWVQITDGCNVRTATSSTVGTAPGNISATGGSDTVTIGAANMPVHNHTFGATSSSVDLGTKTVSTFDHGTKTTSQFDYGTKGTTGTDLGTKTTSGSGSHRHQTGVEGSLNGGGGHTTVPEVPGAGTKTYTDTVGNHTHTVVMGSHSHNVAIGAHTHTVGIGTHNHTVVMGAHTHTVNGTTGNAGGTTALNVTNKVHYYARWKRTA
jgi:hypothetical protein